MLMHSAFFHTSKGYCEAVYTFGALLLPWERTYTTTAGYCVSCRCCTLSCVELVCSKSNSLNFKKGILSFCVQARRQVLRFWGVIYTFRVEIIFVFNVCLKQNFLGTTELGGTKILGELHPNNPVVTDLCVQHFVASWWVIRFFVQ